jgi:hypothetical protein
VRDQGQQPQEWRSSDVYSMYGPWLRMNSTDPAQNGEKAYTRTGFFGYDAAHKRWIVTSVNTRGGYGISYSTSPSFNGASWSNGYPPEKGTATTHMTSSGSYTVDYSGQDDKGHAYSSHQICTKR